jgi:flavin-dependent dehydrogenase
MQADSLVTPRRIAIVGGGPAGALTALLLLHGARELGRELELLILDRKQFGVTGPRGCNMCAGIVGDSLVQRLKDIGLEIPPQVIQRDISGYLLQVGDTRLHLARRPEARIYAAFRSGGPMGEEFGTARSFDHLLRQAAVNAGARHIPRVVRSVKLPAARSEPVVLRDEEGEEYAADVVVGAFGVNSRMVQKFEQLGFGYVGPRTVTACQGEVSLSAQDIDRLFGNEVTVLALDLPGVSLAVMVPKERHVTVSLIGREVGQSHLERFLRMPQVRGHLPAGWELPEHYCHCHPRLPVTAALNPVTDRVVVVGDAHVSRYLKNGLISAFETASLAAQAILFGGVSRANLVRQYVNPCRRMFIRDNRYGRALFGMHALLGRTPSLAEAHLRVALREQEGPEPRPLNRILWGMLSGDERYGPILRQCLSPGPQLRVAGEIIKPTRAARPWPSSPAAEQSEEGAKADD